MVVLVGFLEQVVDCSRNYSGIICILTNLLKKRFLLFIKFIFNVENQIFPIIAEHGVCFSFNLLLLFTKIIAFYRIRFARMQIM